MREAHPTERAVGIDHYVSDADGTGGQLRTHPDDFRVREIERGEFEPIDAAPDAYPHLVFRATLHNWDTNDFAGALSNVLGISRERVARLSFVPAHATRSRLIPRTFESAPAKSLVSQL